MKKLLIVRFSALGDVAMTVPVISALAQQYPDLSITVMSKPFHGALFEKMPANVDFWGVQLRDYKGLKGLETLFREVEQRQFDAVADFHDVLRTKYLRLRMSMNRIRVVHIDKGRADKRRLVKTGAAGVETPLKSSFQRYADVLSALGLPVKLNFTSIFANGTGDLSLLPSPYNSKPSQRIWIGVAPFAAHQGKVYPLDLMEQVIARLNEHGRVFLFGAGEDELATFAAWEEKYQNVLAVATHFKGLSQELILMSHLNVLLSMDSGNMHLASLTATPVVSVWGATHPAAGFMGWNQSLSNAVQISLDCRPCSVYGNKPCRKGNYPCLRQITPEQIVSKVLAHLPLGDK